MGLVTGGMLTYREARQRGLGVAVLVDTALAAGLGGLLLARAVYVGYHWNYYQRHLRTALQVWGGGPAWQGALVGGVIGAAVMSGVREVSLPTVLDALTPGAAAVATAAWLACQPAGCAYGVETYPGQGLLWALSRDLPNVYGIREPRVAVQLLGAGWSALLLAGVLAVGQRRRRGVVFALWSALHSLGAFGLGFLRADEVASIGGWRVDQVLNLLLLAVETVSVMALLVTTREPRAPGESAEE